MEKYLMTCFDVYDWKKYKEIGAHLREIESQMTQRDGKIK